MDSQYARTLSFHTKGASQFLLNMHAPFRCIYVLTIGITSMVRYSIRRKLCYFSVQISCFRVKSTNILVQYYPSSKHCYLVSSVNQRRFTILVEIRTSAMMLPTSCTYCYMQESATSILGSNSKLFEFPRSKFSRLLMKRSFPGFDVSCKSFKLFCVFLIVPHLNASYLKMILMLINTKEKGF